MDVMPLPILEQEMNKNTYASSIFQKGIETTKTQPPPVGQKYPIGSIVRIVSGFCCGRTATVLYTYAHAFPQIDDSKVKDYCLDVDGLGRFSWFSEEQLKPVNKNPNGQNKNTREETEKKTQKRQGPRKG